MKYIKTALFFVMLFSISAFAQKMSAGAQAGYAMTAFEDQDETGKGIPVGGFFGYMIDENIQVGADFNMLASGFSTDDSDIDVTQTIIGGFAKYMMPMEGFSPYGKLGVGYYMGEIKEDAFSLDFKGAIGFNVGAGVASDMGIYGEFVFHIVSRELDIEGAKSSGANNWGIHIGYKLDF